jgi:hypothetical protein
VLPDYVGGQAERPVGAAINRPEVVVPAALGVRPHGLDGVGPAIHEEIVELPHHVGGRRQLRFHAFAPEGLGP